MAEKHVLALVFNHDIKPHIEFIQIFTMTGYKFSKTLSKAFYVFIEVLAAGAIVYLTETPQYIFLVPVFEGFRNYIKHRNR